VGLEPPCDQAESGRDSGEKTRSRLGHGGLVY
jgi:hypothetical protein